MPYIRKEKRAELDPGTVFLASIIETPGELTYVICRLMWRWWRFDFNRRANFTGWCMLRSAVDRKSTRLNSSHRL